MARILFILTVCIVVSTYSCSQIVFDQVDSIRCEQLLKRAHNENWSQKPINEILILAGSDFIGTVYTGHTLELAGEERLIVNLRELDCTTFIENMLVFARLIKKDKTLFSDYCTELQHVRYRNGIIAGYPSRLHYTSDWLFENEKKGVVKNITQELGGKPFLQKINFMTTHSESYKQLSNPVFVKQMQEIETVINQRKYFYIPKQEIEAIESKIRPGDIIGLATSVEGLDITHVGLAISRKGRIYFLHASPNKGVVVTAEPLVDYLNGIKKNVGIVIGRPMEVK